MPRTRTLLPSALVIATLTLTLGGCPWDPATPTNPDNEQATLQPFESADDLLGFFKDQATQRHRSRSTGFGFFTFATPLAADAGAATANDGAAEDAQGGATDFTTTNIQEAGVDESDVFKSDGTHFFIAQDQSVRIVKARPADAMAELARIDFEGRVQALYLFNNQLIVLEQPWLRVDTYASSDDADDEDTSPGDAAVADSVPRVPGLIWYEPAARVVVWSYDISEPAAPAATGAIDLDGWLVTSRLTGGRLYLVLTIAPELPADPTPARINGMTLEEVIPAVRIAGAAQPMVGWQGYYRPATGDGYYTTAVVTIDASNVEQQIGAVAVMADAGTIYASPDALYVTDDEYDYEGTTRHVTKVHKFVFEEQTGARYAGSGIVPGRLLNQFSLGEHDGYLRLATHVAPSFRGGIGIGVPATSVATADTAQANNSNEPYNAVYVMAQLSSELKVIGEIENIAPNEDIYAARFIGPRGYLVTFERIDPLFVIDLSDPANPSLLGELKIPGYSEYLHPFGDNRLIGVGRSTVETPWGGVLPDAVQLSLFDTSDPTDPQLIEQLALGGHGSQSLVSETHKAFTFLESQGLLGLPVRLTADDVTYESYTMELAFDGVLVFDVADTGFSALGRLAAVDAGDRPWWLGDWRRAAFIDNTVYTVSYAGVSAAPLADFGAVGAVELPEAAE